MRGEVKVRWRPAKVVQLFVERSSRRTAAPSVAVAKQRRRLGRTPTHRSMSGDHQRARTARPGARPPPRSPERKGKTNPAPSPESAKGRDRIARRRGRKPIQKRRWYHQNGGPWQQVHSGRRGIAWVVRGSRRAATREASRTCRQRARAALCKARPSGMQVGIRSRLLLLDLVDRTGCDRDTALGTCAEDHGVGKGMV